jgi:hypothetical protein
MKPTIKAIMKGAAIGLSAVAIAIAMSSCVTTTTKTTLPDGTIVEQTVRGPDSESISASAAAASALAPYIIRAEK